VLIPVYFAQFYFFQNSAEIIAQLGTGDEMQKHLFAVVPMRAMIPVES